MLVLVLVLGQSPGVVRVSRFMTIVVIAVRSSLAVIVREVLRTLGNVGVAGLGRVTIVIDFMSHLVVCLAGTRLLDADRRT